MHGREEESINRAPRILGAFQAVVKRAYLKEDERQPRRLGQKATTERVFEVLFEPQVERVPHFPLHVACEEEHGPECYKPRESLFKASAPCTGGGDDGVDEMLGNVDE